MKNYLLNIWKNHRTKTLGFLGMLIGAIQLQFENVRDLIPETWRGSVLFVFGVAAAVIGFINTSAKSDGTP